MAAGDITYDGDAILPGNYRMVWGTVVLDGTNPTPVTLANYMSAAHVGIASIVATGPTGDDLNQVCVSTSGTTLNIEVYKNTSTSNPTMVDSTDNSAVIHWIALGANK
jgi:hypothetical protein